VICSTAVPPLFHRKCLSFHVFRCSAMPARVRGARDTGDVLALLVITHLTHGNHAEQWNTCHHNHLAWNSRGTHTEHARAPSPMPLLSSREEKGVGEIERAACVVCPVQQADRGLAARFQASAGQDASSVGVPARSGLWATPRCSRIVRPGAEVRGSSWGGQTTGNSNPAASVRRGVSTGVM